MNVISTKRVPPWAVPATLLLLACAGTGGGERPIAAARRDSIGGVLHVTSDGPTGWRDTLGWRVVRAGRIRPGEGEPGELVNPNFIALDDDGTVYVSDEKPTVIKQFAPSGAFVRTIGREGHGPGEFVSASIDVHGGYLYVDDPANTRISRFDTAGRYLNSAQASCCMTAPVGTDREGRVYIRALVMGAQRNVPAAMEKGATFFRYSADLSRVDTLQLPPVRAQRYWTLKSSKQTMMMPVLGAPDHLLAVDARGGILTAWSGEYRVARWTGGPDTAMTFGRRWTPEPFAQSVRDSSYEAQVRSLVQDKWPEAAVRMGAPKADMPATLPAMDGILSQPSGHVWVSLPDSTTGPQRVTRMDVFSPDGAWLGRVVVPGVVATWSRISEHELLTLEEGEDGRLGLVRYRLERERRK